MWRRLGRLWRGAPAPGRLEPARGTGAGRVPTAPPPVHPRPDVTITCPLNSHRRFVGWGPHPAARRHSSSMYAGPPSPQQIRQGQLGDCVKLAVAGAVVGLSPKTLQSRLLESGDHVVFRVYDIASQREIDHAMDITVPWFSDGRPLTALSTDGSWWVPMYEKGLAMASAHSLRPTRDYSRYGPRSTELALPGWDSLAYATPPESAAEIMTQLTGLPAEIVPGEAIADEGTRGLQLRCKQISCLHRPVASVFYAIPEQELKAARRYGAHDYHAYWIDRYDASRGIVHLRNPHGHNHLRLDVDHYRRMEPTLIVGRLPITRALVK